MTHKQHSSHLGLLAALLGPALLAANLPNNLMAQRRSIVGEAPLEAGVRRAPAEAYASLPLSFEPNVGQADPRVRFLARGSGYGILLSGNEIRFSLPTQRHPE